MTRTQPSPYPFVHRLLHWSIAIVMSFTLLTILLRMGWLNKFHVAGILDAQLAERGMALPEEELITIAKKIRKPMWDWHIYSGYALVVLYSLRVVYNVASGQGFKLPFRRRSKSFGGQQDLATPRMSGIDKLHGWTYLMFYLFIFGSLLTGLLIEHGPRDWKASLEGVHEYSLHYLVAFIVMHFAGLAWSEWKERSGKVDGMITGRTRE